MSVARCFPIPAHAIGSKMMVMFFGVLSLLPSGTIHENNAMGFGRHMTADLIEVDLQQLPQQPLRRSGAASWLDQEVENFTFVVDRPPQPMQIHPPPTHNTIFGAADPDDHFVKVPTSTGTWTAAAKIA